VQIAVELYMSRTSFSFYYVLCSSSSSSSGGGGSNGVMYLKLQTFNLVDFWDSIIG
jgi:hypothetical protein